ncbi:MAG TPA: Ku protein [Steroidobacteraceae bacterium]|jgi:DNA end-binding protein Ku
MPRAIWKGAISFSLVHIPVSLHTAARHHDLDLDLLDKRDFSPVGYQRVSKKTGKTVEWRDIVKGYQYKKGDYVVLTDEDFRRANVEASRTIDIQLFVERSAIAPYYFDTPYYVTPEGQGEKVYTLLRNALAQSNKLAVASFVLRSREHLATLSPENGVLVLNTLRFEQEILPQPKIEGVPKATRRTGNGKELQTALRLIEEMSAPWHPEKYRDTYRDDLMKRIRQKVKAGASKTLTMPEKGEEREERGKVVDLMALLQKSLDQTRRGPQRARSRRTGRAAARRAS